MKSLEDDNLEQNINNSVLRKQRERFLRKKRKRIKKLKSFFKFLLLILFIYVIYAIVNLPQWYLPSDVFSKPDAKVVRILNNEILPDKVLYDALKDVNVPSRPIFLMSTKNIKRELFKIPVIKKVYVRRYGFPARIQIIVRERIPVTVVKPGLKSKPLAFSTQDGVFVTNSEYMPLIEAKPVLQILSRDIKDWDIKKIENIRKIVKSVEAYSAEKVLYVDMLNQNDVYVRIESTNVRLGVLDSSVFDRIKRLYTILPQIDKIDGQIKYIDLSWDKVNYLKLQSEAKDEVKDGDKKDKKSDE